MLRSLSAAVVLTLVTTTSLASAKEPTPDEVERARTFFNAGAQAYSAARYSEAVRSFDQAYELAPRPQLLFSLAQAERKEFFASNDAVVSEARRPALQGVPRSGPERRPPIGGDGGEGRPRSAARAPRPGTGRGRTRAAREAEGARDRVLGDRRRAGLGRRRPRAGAPVLRRSRAWEASHPRLRRGLLRRGARGVGRQGGRSAGRPAAQGAPVARHGRARHQRRHLRRRTHRRDRAASSRPIEIAAGAARDQRVGERQEAALRGGRPPARQAVPLRAEARDERPADRRVHDARRRRRGDRHAAPSSARSRSGRRAARRTFSTTARRGTSTADQLQTYNRSIDKRDAFRTASIVGLGAGAAFAAGGALLYLFDRPTISVVPPRSVEPTPAPRTLQPTDLTASPFVGPGIWGASMSARF